MPVRPPRHKLLPVLLLASLAAGCVTSSSLPRLTAELSDPATSNERCLTIVHRLRHAEIHQTGGALIDLLGSERLQPPNYLRPGSALGRMPTELRLEIAARGIFTTYLKSPGSTTEKTEFLCQLLQARHDTEGRRILLQLLEHDCWSPVAEASLAAIAADPQAAAPLRAYAFSILLSRCDSSRYCGAAFSLIQSVPLTREPVTWGPSMGPWSIRILCFTMILDCADRLSPDNRTALLRLGFAILREAQATDNCDAIQLASALGTALGIKGRFEPDRNSPRYENPSQPNQLYYKDIVTNALTWAEANGF